MQKARLLSILLALLVLLSACTTAPGEQSPSGSTTPEEQPPEETPAPVSYDADNTLAFGFSVINTMAESEEAYYFASLGAKQVVYSDKLTGQQGVLCGKPDCTHTDETCSGYTGVRAQFLQYYGGKLYWVGFNPEYPIKPKAPKMYGIWRMNKDGTERGPVKLIDESENRLTEGSVYDLRLHRGRVYLLEHMNGVKNGSPFQRLRVLSASIEGEDDYAPIFEKVYDTNVNLFRRMYPIGDSIYIIASAVYGKIVEGRTYRFEAFRYDITTGQTETLCDSEMDFAVSATWVTPEGKIWMTGQVGQANVFCSVENGVITERFRLEGPEMTFSGVAISGGIAWCNAMIGENMDRYIWVVDLEGRTLYKGIWDVFPEGEERTRIGISPMKGSRDCIMFMFSADKAFCVRWDITENGLKRVPIIGK